MTKLYVCEISNLIEEVKAEENVLNTYFDKLGKERIAHILKHSKAEDRARSLGVSLLLLFALQQEKTDISKLPDFSYIENGKPYLKELENLYFNLSHTKNIIACVISNVEVGVDVEHVREIKENTINRVFTEREKALIGFNIEGYIQLWTTKEACAKVQGKGLADILDGLEIVETENGKFIQKLNQDIIKTFCYRVIAEGKVQDSDQYPYYYSVCTENIGSRKDALETNVQIIKLQWDKKNFINSN